MKQKYIRSIYISILLTKMDILPKELILCICDFLTFFGKKKFSSLNKNYLNFFKKIRNFIKTNLMIDLNNSNKLEDVITYLYETSRIDFILFKNKKYYEIINKWGGTASIMNDKGKSMYCEGSEHCDIKCNFFPNNPDEVKYVLEMHHNTNMYIYKIQNINLIRKIKNYDWDKVLFCDYKFNKTYVNLNNKSGYNSDHRGSTHCEVYLKFYDTIRLNIPFTLHELADKLIRIKSHKWNYWYEFYMKSELDYKNLDMIDINVFFDHGS